MEKIYIDILGEDTITRMFLKSMNEN